MSELSGAWSNMRSLVWAGRRRRLPEAGPRSCFCRARSGSRQPSKQGLSRGGVVHRHGLRVGGHLSYCNGCWRAPGTTAQGRAGKRRRYGDEVIPFVVKLEAAVALLGTPSEGKTPPQHKSPLSSWTGIALFIGGRHRVCVQPFSKAKPEPQPFQTRARCLAADIAAPKNRNQSARPRARRTDRPTLMLPTTADTAPKVYAQVPGPADGAVRHVRDARRHHGHVSPRRSRRTLRHPLLCLHRGCPRAAPGGDGESQIATPAPCFEIARSPWATPKLA